MQRHCSVYDDVDDACDRSYMKVAAIQFFGTLTGSCPKCCVVRWFREGMAFALSKPSAATDRIKEMRHVVALLVFSVVSSAIASAQSVEPRFEIGGQASVLRLSDFDTTNAGLGVGCCFA